MGQAATTLGSVAAMYLLHVLVTLAWIGVSRLLRPRQRLTVWMWIPPATLIKFDSIPRKRNGPSAEAAGASLPSSNGDDSDSAFRDAVSESGRARNILAQAIRRAQALVK